MSAIVQDILIEQNASWSLNIVVTVNNLPINISGYEFFMQIRNLPVGIKNSKIIASPISTITDAINGKVVFALTANDTSNIPITGHTYEDYTRLVYDIDMVDAIGIVTRLYNGDVDVSPGITVVNNYIFTDDTARDAYFSLHPSELVIGLLIVSNNITEKWTGTMWITVQGETASKVNLVNYIADSGGINAYTIVFISTSNTVQTANSSNQTMAGRVVGMSIANAVGNANVTVQSLGPITNPAWNLTPGIPYYFDNGGNPISTSPIIGFTQKIGVAENPTTLFLQIEPAILLN